MILLNKFIYSNLLKNAQEDGLYSFKININTVNVTLDDNKYYTLFSSLNYVRKNFRKYIENVFKRSQTNWVRFEELPGRTCITVYLNGENKCSIGIYHDIDIKNVINRYKKFLNGEKDDSAFINGLFQFYNLKD